MGETIGEAEECAMQLELLPGWEYPQASGALFAEYTDMLVREDPAFASYLELQL